MPSAAPAPDDLTLPERRAEMKFLRDTIAQVERDRMFAEGVAYGLSALHRGENPRVLLPKYEALLKRQEESLERMARELAELTGESTKHG